MSAAAYKADPYGTDQPSPIPNPTRTPSGEPVPSPGKPPGGVPDYLKPIPVNTRDIEEVMRGHLNAKEPEVQRWLYSTWTAEREAIKYQELRNAKKTGKISDQWLRRWQQAYATMINEQLAPQWRKTMMSAADAAAKQAADNGFTLAFSEQATRVEKWIQHRGGELIVNLTERQHRATRNLLEHYTIKQPVGAEELGRILRPTVGLTPKQSNAVKNMRDRLIDEGELTRKQIEHQVQNYSARLHRVRAKRIARTELSFAYNNGMQETMRQSIEEGAVRGEIQKRVLTGRDEGVCSHCGPLDGEVVGLEQTLPGATKKVPNTYTPPFHPGCRCTIIYEVVRQSN